METKKLQIFSFALVAVSMLAAAAQGLSLASERYFYLLEISRLALGLTAFLMMLFSFEKGRSLPEGTASLLFLTVALSESFLAYLQNDVTGISYLIVCSSLFLGSAISFVSLRASLLSMLPSQLTILAVPLMSLSHRTWSNRVLVTQTLFLPLLTLLASLVVWILNSFLVHRAQVKQNLKSMKKRQDLLQAQMLLLKKQPKTLRLPELHETIRAKSEESHASKKQNAVSDQVLLSDLTDWLRECLNVAQSKVADKRKIRVSLDLPAPMSLPVLVAAEKNDLRKILASAITKSVGSLNSDDGVLRVGLRVGFKAVSISIEDNGWGLREKFSPNSDLEHELSLREIQAMVKFWGGRFEVLSRLGVGSRMQIELERVDSFVAGDQEERKVINELEAHSTSHTTAGS